MCRRFKQHMPMTMPFMMCMAWAKSVSSVCRAWPSRRR